MRFVLGFAFLSFGFWVFLGADARECWPLKTQNPKLKTQIEYRSRRFGARVFLVGNL
jgi:hypothetical protein